MHASHGSLVPRTGPPPLRTRSGLPGKRFVGGGTRTFLLKSTECRPRTPWGRLAGITLRSGIAAVPAFWISRNVALPPLVAVASIAVVYGAAFSTLWLISHYWEGSRVDVALKQDPKSCVA